MQNEGGRRTKNERRVRKEKIGRIKNIGGIVKNKRGRREKNKRRVRKDKKRKWGIKEKIRNGDQTERSWIIKIIRNSKIKGCWNKKNIRRSLIKVSRRRKVKNLKTQITIRIWREHVKNSIRKWQKTKRIIRISSSS